MFLIPLLTLFASTASAIPTPEKDDTLILLHVLFRHGDRTPETSELYPTDPYHADTSFPEGLGELTNAGKKREHQIGQALRKKYDSFLGSFKSNNIIATTTDFSRTKMSCLLVLSGLYPPNENQIWKTGFNWQPIPYSYTQYYSDYLLGDPTVVCPQFIKKYNDYLSKEKDTIYEKNKKLYDYVSLHSGLKITRPQQIYNLQFLLNSEEAMGLKLPEWTNNIWPENITKAAAEEYYLAFATPEMKKLAGGPLFKKIIDDTNTKIAINSTDEHKLYLYSAHENNLAYFLIHLDAFYPHIPPYGSYIVFEVHQIHNTYGVKIFYENYTKNSGYIKIPGCGQFCPFDKFVGLMKDSLPATHDVCLQKE
ncbi:hypothetical protein RN001_004497 [Aquatica leii]|uniref:acid phosphatase n=1 Tax=Aquatica leii TaxID=1421715 RepID=A0AAN7QJL7_9COLE|nr:hypothetical protein RN001_004497 [Aquatica leii]